MKSLERMLKQPKDSNLLEKAHISESEVQEQANLEETILKLVKHARSKVKFEDFTSVDRFNMIDLFVNNERTYTYIYKALFQENNDSSNQNEKRERRPKRIIIEEEQQKNNTISN